MSEKPSRVDDLAGAHRAAVQSSIDEFNNHKGNILSNQITQHKQSLPSLTKDIINKFISNN